jgi:ABC-2 type transport system permease protein
MSSALGIIMGSVAQKMDAMLGLLKALGILLFAPGILALFPQAPDWIARVFPTYYMLNPLLEVSQRGAGLGDIAVELAILAAMVGVLLLALTWVIERQQEQLALAG